MICLPLCVRGQLTTTVTTNKYPYSSSSTPLAIEKGAANASATSDRFSGAIGLTADAWIGGATTKALHYVTVPVTSPSRVTIEAQITYIEALSTVGAAGLAGTDFVWTIDNGMSGSEVINSPYGPDDIAQLIVDLAWTLAGVVGTVGDVAGLIVDTVEGAAAASLAASLETAYQDGDADRKTFRFTFDADIGNYDVGVGLMASAAGAATGFGIAQVLAQLDFVKVTIQELPYKVTVKVKNADISGVSKKIGDSYAPPDFGSLPDPFIKVYIGDPNFRYIDETGHKSNTTSPTWNKEIVAVTDRDSIDLRVELWDKDKNWNDHLDTSSVHSYYLPNVLTTVHTSFSPLPTVYYSILAEVTTENPPQAVAMADVTVNKGQSITFNGAGSYDPDGSLFLYRWEPLSGGWPSGGSGWIVWNGSGSWQTTAPTIAGEFVMRLTVMDVHLKTSSDTVNVTVLGGAPTARPEATTVVGSFDTVFFSGAQSFDPDGDIAEYRWTFDPAWGSPSTSGWIPWDGEGLFTHGAPGAPGAYIARLWVQDHQGHIASATVQVSVIPTTLVVNNLGDTDDGQIVYQPGAVNTLRKCIRLANIGPGPNVIRFGVTGTVSPASPLPAITDNETSIDGGNRWQGGWPSGEPGIVINGSNPSSGGIGVHFSSADQCRVRGVRITNFSTALYIDSSSDQAVIGGLGTKQRNVLDNLYCGGDDNHIAGNYIGLNGPGTGSNGGGLTVASTADGNVIGPRNVIYGAVQVDGSDNRLEGNYFGTDKTGTVFLPASHNHGIRVSGNENTVGGTGSSQRNVILSGQFNAIWIDGSSSNTVAGNYIGLDVTGTNSPAGTVEAVRIDGGGQHNVVGGLFRGAGNVIAGHQDAVVIHGAGTHNNAVQGNLIGTDCTGTNAIGNARYGVTILFGPETNEVGGTLSSAGNVIGGCLTGVHIQNAHNNTVYYNYIGTDSELEHDLGNTEHGIAIWSGNSNRIGVPANWIRNNGFYGVLIAGGQNNPISRNGIAQNTVQGISLQNGGNANLSPPVLTSVSTYLGEVYVAGNCLVPGGIVEMFGTVPGGNPQGETYLGSLIAGPLGEFEGTMLFPDAVDYVTATVTDPVENTSEFSSPATQVVAYQEDEFGNGDFVGGLGGWDSFTSDGSGGPAAGQTSADVGSGDPGPEPYLVVQRILSDETPGSSGVTRELNMPVSGWGVLALHLEVQVMMQTLQGGGPDGEDYPANVVLVYEDEQGSERLWYHGFYAVGASVEPLSSMPVPLGGWLPFGTPNLMDLDFPPAFLKEIQLFGSGWDYESRFANVTLILGEPRLRIEPDDDNVRLSWPANADGYQLESCTSLAPAAPWTPVPGVPQVIGIDHYMTQPGIAPVQIYRLLQ
jgi:hypothetical protein